MLKVKDLVSAKPVTVKAETPLVDAFAMLNNSSMKTLPVVDDQGRLVGLLREKDLVKNHTHVHLSTLFKLLQKFDYYKQDRTLIEGDLQKILSLKVKDAMTAKLDAVQEDGSIEEALNLFAKSESEALPVLNKAGKVVSMVSLTDMTKYYGVALKSDMVEGEIDRSVDAFLNNFEKQFVVVSKFHTKMWMLFSILFTFVGFFIATLFLIRISA